MKRTVFAAHSKIRNTLFLFIAIVIALFLFLKGGISISHFKIGSFDIAGLYLKLDKKLIVRTDRLIIPQRKKNTPLPNIEEGLDQVEKILRYFQYIELKEVDFKNDHYTLLYADNILYMTNDEYEIAAKEVHRIGDELHADIDLVYLKKYDIRLSGKLTYNFDKDTLLVRGNAEYLDIHSEFVIDKHQHRLYYVLKTNDFTQLKPLIDQFKIPPKISVWITDKLKAKKYRLESLKGMATVSKKGFRLLPDTITAEAILDHPVLFFKDGIDPVEAKQAKLTFAKGSLEIDPTEPHMKGRSGVGSKATISEMTNPKPVMLRLDLKLNTALDPEVHKILHAYKIKLPLMQPEGTTETRLIIDVDLKAKKAHFIGDFNFGKGKVAIGKVKLSVDGGSVHVEKGVATLSGIKLHDSWYQGTVNGKVYLKKKKIDLSLDIASLDLGTKEKRFLSIRKTKLPLAINFQKDLLFSLPTVKTDIRVSAKDKSTVIEIGDLSIIKKYLRNFPVTIDGGNLKIRTKDFVHYQYSGLVKRNGCFFYQKETACLTRVPISGSFSKDKLIFNAFQKRFSYNSQKSLINLTNLNLDLKAFFKHLEKKSVKQSGGMTQQIKVKGKKSAIRYEKFKLLTDSYTMLLPAGGNFTFDGRLGSDTVTVVKKKKNLTIKALRITDKMLHPLINFSGLQKGRYSVIISGDPDKVMKGEITLDGGVMRDFKAYNNVLAFINAIPALATLNSPGFSSKGYKIKKGSIKFSISDDKLFFDSVFVEGSSATISGDGVVDLKTKAVNVELAIQTVREIGKVVGSVPVVGYILTGENKGVVTVGLKISGTLENPRVKTNPVKDVLLMPFDMIKRTLTTPAHIKKNLEKK